MDLQRIEQIFGICWLRSFGLKLKLNIPAILPCIRLKVNSVPSIAHKIVKQNKFERK